MRPLKVAVSQDFLQFFYELNPFRSLIISLKWFSCKIRFREDIREKRDSVQCDTALSQEIEMSKNPKLSNTAWSRTQCSFSLRQVKQFFFLRKLLFPSVLRIRTTFDRIRI